MKAVSRLFFSTVVITLFSLKLQADPAGRFDIENDLFLPQFDSKTDVDDLHSAAGVATLLRDTRFSAVRYHAVAGAYGTQGGLYVPAPELFELAFGENWSNAHEDRDQALETVSGLVIETLAQGGHVWVAEAGQSDFTADWLKQVRQSGMQAQTGGQVHVVQHSDWNESVTSPDKLAYVRQHTSYHRIADGNLENNGTPGLKMGSDHLWASVIQDPVVGPIWLLAKDIADRYNAAEGRYNNEAIGAGGMDFSDVSETCWIFGFGGLSDAHAFFNEFLP